MDIKTILFDLGNVTVSFDHNLAVRRIKFFTNKEEDEIYPLFFDSDLTKIFEEGKVAPYDFYLKIKDLLNLKINYEQFLPIWNEIFFLTADNLKIHNLIRRFKQRFRLILVSNINQLHYEYLKDKYDIFDEFDNLVLSYRIGTRKPEPLIYKQALSLADADNRQALYIDDRLDLVEAAKNLKIRSLQFKNFLQLKKDLMNIGLEIF